MLSGSEFNLKLFCEPLNHKLYDAIKCLCMKQGMHFAE